jgi:hypothetical protein
MDSIRCFACHNTSKLGSWPRLGQDKGNGPKKFPRHGKNPKTIPRWNGSVEGAWRRGALLTIKCTLTLEIGSPKVSQSFGGPNLVHVEHFFISLEIFQRIIK